MTSTNRRWRCIGLALALGAPFAAFANAQQITVVDVIPASASQETWQDSEPTIAVNPLNVEEIAVSSFTRNYFDLSDNALAPMFVSTDGGMTWAANNIIPGGPETGDITIGFSPNSGYLYAAILRYDDLTLNVLRTRDLLSPLPMETLFERDVDDQPFIEATTDRQGADEVLVSSNENANESRDGGHTAIFDLSTNAGRALPVKFEDFGLDKRRIVPVRDGPAVRSAIDADGRAYGAFISWRSETPEAGEAKDASIDVIVVRDDDVGASSHPFSALAERGDAGQGVSVVTNRPFRYGASIGNERLSGDLSIASDYRHSGRVYLAWGDGLGDQYSLHVRRSLSAGARWSDDLLRLPNAVNPSLAINDKGVVALLYQQYRDGAWHTVIALSDDGLFGQSTKFEELSMAPALEPTAEPLLGDYDKVLSVGKDFYGVFAADNLPINANFPSGVTFQRYADFSTGTLFSDATHTHAVEHSIDPFYFHVSM